MRQLLEGSGALGHDVGVGELGSLKAALEYIATNNRCSLSQALTVYNKEREQEGMPPAKAQFLVTFDVGSMTVFEAPTMAVSPLKALANVIARKAQELPTNMRNLGLFIGKAKTSDRTQVKLVLRSDPMPA